MLTLGLRAGYTNRATRETKGLIFFFFTALHCKNMGKMDIARKTNVRVESIKQTSNNHCPFSVFALIKVEYWVFFAKSERCWEENMQVG